MYEVIFDAETYKSQSNLIGYRKIKFKKIAVQNKYRFNSEKDEIAEVILSGERAYSYFFKKMMLNTKKHL